MRKPSKSTATPKRVTLWSIRSMMSPASRRAITTAEVGFGNRQPTPGECIALAEAVRATPAVVLARYGYLPSTIKGRKRGVWTRLDYPSARAQLPGDADTLAALVLWQFAGGEVRCRLTDPPAA